MRRREFIGVLAGAAFVGSLYARAQRPTIPVVGFLHPSSLDNFEALVAAFRLGMKETGYTEGENVAIEYRWADGQEDRLPKLALELVRQQVAVIATPGSTPATLAAKAATASIPIVFAVGLDPVELGLVASLGSPGGNLTGIAMLALEMTVKQLELLSELVPRATVIAVLRNPNNPGAEIATKSLSSAARGLGRQIIFLNARNDDEIESVLSTLQAGALLILPDAYFISRRERIATLAARNAIPSIYQRREYLEVGGLASYGEHYPDTWRQVGVYVGRILSGAKPGDLPVLQPSKFQFVINLKAANTLRLTIPQSILLRADEVIE